MERKLLVITAGTVAAGVGKEFIRQRRAHGETSELKAAVRYIDTADLQTRYSDLHDGEWLQVSIEPRFIDNIQRNEQDYPYLKPMLFDNLMPQIQGSGGGSIRYNAAGAVAIGRDTLKEWIHNGITNLISSGDGQVNLSIALVVSAVGATGSGALERLVEIIIEAAQDAKIPSPIHCDVFILQPGPQDVTDLGLSNTFALFAEMAASRLSRIQLNNKSYRGRTILVDWGTKTNMASIDQLKESAATLLRLSNDPATDIAAEYQEREVDNHVLRELDAQSGLPSHLSTATAVTISLGDLQEKIIQRDAARLIDLLVFGKNVPSQTSGGDFIATTVDETATASNSMLSVLSDLLSGQTAEARLSHLLLRLKDVLPLQTLQLNQGRLRDLTPRDQAGRLRGSWQSDKDTLIQSRGQSIRVRGAELAGSAVRFMDDTSKNRLGTGLSLEQLEKDFQDLHNKIEEVTRKLQEMNPGGEEASTQQVGDDRLVNNKLSALERANRWNRQTAFSQAFNAVQNDIESRVKLETIKAAYDVLDVLEQFSGRMLRDLKAVLKKLRDQRKKNAAWGAVADKELRIEMHHPLHLAALPTHEEITKYIEQVSIFTMEKKKRRSNAVDRIMRGDNQEEDQLADFRRWLDEDEERIGKLFRGDIELFLNLAQQYTRAQVDEEVKENNVLKVLIRAGDEVLKRRMAEAADKAHSLVSFSKEFAPEMRQATHVSAYWETPEERELLQKAINEAFGQRRCTLIKSKGPTEIAVFYYVDGLPMSAITDLAGRCLDRFMKRRRAWQLLSGNMQNGHSNGHTPVSTSFNMRVGVPVYSGKDTQQRVEETGIIQLLYRVRGQNVAEYSKEDVPEMASATQPLNATPIPNGNGGTNGSSGTGSNE
ncbi:MAG: hypothetical protein ABI406_12890 [Ktedonobacteraceae bacterium]